MNWLFLAGELKADDGSVRPVYRRRHSIMGDVRGRLRCGDFRLLSSQCWFWEMSLWVWWQGVVLRLESRAEEVWTEQFEGEVT